MKGKASEKAEKLQHLKEILLEMGSVLIAYSGGVDSTFLLKVAKEVLGGKVAAVTATSSSYPSRELEDAKRIAGELGIKHIIIETFELSDPKFAKNAQDRCYWCKKELFFKLVNLTREHKLNFCLDGSNYDDTNDFRPGMKAAEELGVRSPLKEAGLTKVEIRSFSKRFGLSTWGKPSFACLASRFPYGTKITEDTLARVDEAERFLRGLGITQVRVRHHNETARIEVLKKEMPRLLRQEIRNEVVSKFKKLGYVYVTVDLEGYRTGSMNLPHPPPAGRGGSKGHPLSSLARGLRRKTAALKGDGKK